MEILKTAIDWAKSEVFSSMFFIAAGLIFLIGGIGFWQLGKTEMAKSYIWPMLVAGVLILTVGIGIFVANKGRVTSFEADYNQDAGAFVKTEIQRTEKSMGEYKNIVFKVIPFIMIAAALLIVFVNKPLWRAVGITTIVMMTVIMLVDSNADARLKNYHKELKSIEN